MGITKKNEKSSYSDEELAEFEIIIDKKLEKAQEQLDFYLQQIQEIADSPEIKIKSIDDGPNSLETERIYTLASRQRSLIQHLQNAKHRIKKKVYGICRKTGKLISKERLKAVPHATLCIEAKQNR